jgi:hypothetical protein
MRSEIFDSIKEAADDKEAEIMQIEDRRERFLKLRSLVALLRGFRAEGEKED